MLLLPSFSAFSALGDPASSPALLLPLPLVLLFSDEASLLELLELLAAVTAEVTTTALEDPDDLKGESPQTFNLIPVVHLLIFFFSTKCS